ncbi:MAG: glutamate-5-semialdehyde dehydrogenase [Christensenellaceae bacterium]
MTVKEICQAAKAGAPVVAYAPVDMMNAMLQAAATALRKNAYYLMEENARDVEACTRGEQFVDRLRLTRERIESIAQGLEKLIALPTPVGEIMEQYFAPNGMQITRVRVPLGVIGIIYEARPNVTADAIGLCIKSGNAVVLRGSKDALRSNRAIVSVIKQSIREIGYSPEFIQIIEDGDHASAHELMHMNGLVDVIIPRGGASLIRDAVKNATVPIIETGTGNCHLYVENSANVVMATQILINAKTQRTSVCNACESLVVDELIARNFLPLAIGVLREKGVEVRGDEKTRAIVPDVIPATEEDFYTEYLASTISVKIVKDISEAIPFINEHSTHHSEAIVTKNPLFAERFLNEIDSAAVYVNASTRFTDGFEFGFGAEMGISTQKLHARGPMGLRELTSYKYQIRGNGQVRG